MADKMERPRLRLLWLMLLAASLNASLAMLALGLRSTPISINDRPLDFRESGRNVRCSRYSYDPPIDGTAQSHLISGVRRQRFRLRQ